jgi:hypothetical protein
MNDEAPKVKQPTNEFHFGMNGKLLSDYEMFVIFKPGNKIRTRTYRGDNTISEYAVYKTPFPNQWVALCYKLTNIEARVETATIYDNTGPTKRVVRGIYKNGIWEVNTLIADKK